MELTKKFPVALLLATLSLALVVAGSVAMIVISLIKPAVSSAPAMGTPGPDLTVLSNPALNQLSEYDANAVYPVPIGAGDLSRDNPFAEY